MDRSKETKRNREKRKYARKIRQIREREYKIKSTFGNRLTSNTMAYYFYIEKYNSSRR